MANYVWEGGLSSDSLKVEHREKVKPAQFSVPANWLVGHYCYNRGLIIGLQERLPVWLPVARPMLYYRHYPGK